MATDTTREQMDRYGLACLKAFLLVNGGAAVALLALIAHLIVERPPSLPPGVTNEIILALEIFLWGMVSGITSTGASYLGVWCYGHGERIGQMDRWNRIGENIFVPIAVILGAGSIGAFIYGAFTAGAALKAALSG